jgi:4-carboxymuconolactone decarboxylase
MLQRISAVVLCSAFIAACGAPPPTAVNESALDEPTSAAPSGVFVPHEVTSADIPADIQEDSWARLPTLARETLGPDGQRVFDSIVGPESRYSTGLRGPVGMWMYSPRMAEHIFPASTYLRFGADGQRDQRLTELAILVTARELNSQYEWSAHEGLARTAGLEEKIIELVRTGGLLTDAPLPGLNEQERIIVQVGRELVNEPKLSREAFETAQRLFGNEGLMDLAGLIGYYTFVNYTLKTFDVQRAPGTQLLLPLP